MGTRCITRVFDEQDHEILCLQTWGRGWPAAHGIELAKFLGTRILVNGLSREKEQLARALGKKLANRMGCLAAQLVAHFVAQNDTAEHYILAPGESGGEEWLYEVRCGGAPHAETRADAPMVFFQLLCAEVQPVLPRVVRRRERVRFEGPLTEFSKWLEGQEHP